MTEADWLACTDPARMLAFLRGRAGDRKLRLFACACCRQLWEMLKDVRSRRVVEMAEQYADGQATAQNLRAARERAEEVCDRASERLWHPASFRYGEAPPLTAAQEDAAWRAARTSILSEAPQKVALRVVHGLRGDDLSIPYAALLRDIFGPLPFRPIRLNLAWLAWEGGTVPKLAAVTYEERAFDRLPILADALEEAGCTDLDVLGHCRQPGEHVRGCWVVDFLLGKS